MNKTPVRRLATLMLAASALAAAALAPACADTLVATVAAAPMPAEAAAMQPSVVGDDDLIKVRSAYGMDETIARIRADIAAKGIQFFSTIDQQQLAAGAGIALRRSTLLTFGNPPLGVQFLTANPYAGLDWPVRLLVLEDESGSVWAAWTDFAWIARRHHIDNRGEQFAKATSVVESITSTVRAR